MKYETGADFRRALEDRLLAQGRSTGRPLIRLRRAVVFDRFLARLLVAEPGAWVLKGGLALQLRLGDRARVTNDVDVLLVEPLADLRVIVAEAALLDLGDWFRFTVTMPEVPLPDEADTVRFRVLGLLDGRRFETFNLDIGIHDRLLEPTEALTMPDLLQFAGIVPATIRCYSIGQQIAEKVHAYTQTYASGSSTRVKDLVDIVLIAGIGPVRSGTLRQAFQLTFAARGLRHAPGRLPDAPVGWDAQYARLAREIGLDHRSVAEAVGAARKFLDPVLGNDLKDDAMWSPGDWRWRT